MAEIDADKIEINCLFDNFWFLIPEYQRSYVWEEDNINDLLDDLWFAFENKKEDEYFLGSLVLKKTSESNFNEYEVLDGQQRLTTFFILMAVIRDIAKNEDLKSACHERIYQKENKFRKIPERTRLEFKIRDNVGTFINNYILKEGKTLSDDVIEKKDEKNVSISHMARAIITIKDFFSTKTDNQIEDFGIYIAEKPIFIYVSTESMEDAFRMFTILNNRGLPLTNSDILKSINIGKISNEKDQQKYALIWEKIESDLGDEFDRFLSYIRTIIVKEKARLSLLDEFNENIYAKSKLKKGEETINLISQIKDYYDKIITFQSDINLPNEYKNLLTIMQIGLPSTDWIPPLLLFYQKFSYNNIFKFLEKLEFKFSSDWIVQLTPTQRIENLNDILKAITKADTTEKILNNESLFAVDTNELCKRLSGDIYGRRFTRYILLKYEYLLGDNTVHLSNYKTISVEHVLPQNPNDNSNWKKTFTEEQIDYWKHKIANLVLISKRKNSSLANLDFSEKKERYLKGRMDVFPSNKIFQNYTDWSVDILEKRQKEMVSKLTKTT